LWLLQHEEKGFDRWKKMEGAVKWIMDFGKEEVGGKSV
jgi:hypothetical protein